MNVRIEMSDGQVSAVSPYNDLLPSRAKRLGGRWKNGAWVFPAHVESEVRELYHFVYGTDGTTAVEMTAIDVVLDGDGAVRDHVSIAGIPIARVFGRDSGAKLAEGVALLKGRFKSGGSRKNFHIEWTTGTTVRLEVPLKLLGDIRDDSEVESVTVVSGDNARQKLISEREALVARLAEIDAELAGGKQ